MAVGGAVLTVVVDSKHLDADARDDHFVVLAEDRELDYTAPLIRPDDPSGVLIGGLADFNHKQSLRCIPGNQDVGEGGKNGSKNGSQKRVQEWVHKWAQKWVSF